MSVALTILLIAFCVQGLVKFAIQADPGLAWREIILMTALFVWAPYELVGKLMD